MEETLLQKAKRLKIQPSVIPEAETLLEKAQRLGIKPVNKLVETETPNYFQRVGQSFQQIGKDITSAVETGAKAITDTDRSPVRRTTDVFRSGLRTAGGVARGAFAPIFEAPVIKQATEFAVRKLSQAPGAEQVIATATDLANRYPERAKDLRDVVDIVSLGYAPKAVSLVGKETKAIGSDIAQATNIALNPSEKEIQSRIIGLFQKSIKPTAKKTLPQAEKYENDILKALKTIKSNVDNLNIEDDVGELVSRTPQTLSELAQGVDQTRKLVFDQYDALAKQAGTGGATVDAKPIAAEVLKVAENQALQITNPEVVKYAEQWAERLQGLGQIDTETTQAVIQNLNNSLKAFYKNPTYEAASKVSVDAGIVNNFRKSLDEAIENATGKEYQSLKDQYGALKAIENDVVRAAMRDARKNTKGLLDYTDIFTSGQMIGGILSLNPAMFTSGAIERGFKEFYKMLNDPNRAVGNMFDLLDTSATLPFNPASLTGKYLQNPKLGMAIEDVSRSSSDGGLPPKGSGTPQKGLLTPPQTTTSAKGTQAPKAQGEIPLTSDAKSLKTTGGVEMANINRAIAKFDKTGTADVITGKNYGVSIKDEGDFISVRYGSNDLTPVGSFPSGEKNFATKKEAFDFVKELQSTLSSKKILELGFKNFTDLSTKLLGKLEGRTKVSKQFIEDLTNSPDLKQPERDLFRELLKKEGDIVDVPTFANKVKTELLPLKTNKQINARYENITLPDESRGSVANYEERVYQSPIKTSAGDVHFSSYGSNSRRAGTDEAPNYFAHTRVEDMAYDPKKLNPVRKEVAGGVEVSYPNAEKTRRVIELQSDLFQKGRLEGEVMSEKQLAGYPDLVKDNVTKGRDARKLEITKLEPYRNTWQERIIREEVKQAAIDGKTKLQFPTGETAMKIEGLGDVGGTAQWWESSRYWSSSPVKLKAENLKVGDEVIQGSIQTRGEGEWIITDVLGDGKFKAVPKEQSDIAVRHTGVKVGSDKWIAELDSSDIESFDISGKIDESNPIFKFYEKEVGRYLKNKYNATLITDPQGVKWYEVKIDKSMKKLPIEAFGAAPLLLLGEDEDE